MTNSARHTVKSKFGPLRSLVWWRLDVGRYYFCTSTFVLSSQLHCYLLPTLTILVSQGPHRFKSVILFPCILPFPFTAPFTTFLCYLFSRPMCTAPGPRGPVGLKKVQVVRVSRARFSIKSVLNWTLLGCSYRLPHSCAFSCFYFTFRAVALIFFRWSEAWTGCFI